MATPSRPIPRVEDRREVIDWRTIDPEKIRARSFLVEELLTYRSRLDNLLATSPGKYVLIVGSEIVSIFPDLDQAARYAERYRGRPVLIKKIAEVEPVHTLGGALPVRAGSIGGPEA